MAELRPLRVKTPEKEGRITTFGRRKLSAGQFALPPREEEKAGGQAGRFPIDTVERGRNALARAQQEKAGLSDSEKAQVKRKVCQKYPFIKSCRAKE